MIERADLEKVGGTAKDIDRKSASPVAMTYHREFVADLVSRGGPDADEYLDLDAWLAEISEMRRSGKIGSVELAALVDTFGSAFSLDTMQGFAFRKPHGYAGDFEIIDRIYQRHHASDTHLRKWDEYWQRHAAAEAVRNRVTYFIEQVEKYCDGRDQSSDVQVLNLASGPCRDLLELFRGRSPRGLVVHCVEQDQNAIQHGKMLCDEYLDRLRFYNRNALRYRSEIKFDLIWSAGLFDYFDDEVFVYMLRRLGTMLKQSGEIVIGNFSTTNPSRPYMELFDWVLHHRSPQTLRNLAREAGFSKECIRVGREPLAVNLFLHLSGSKG